MTKTLILVRHGEAEPGSPDVIDSARHLTDAGRAALAAPTGFPRTFALLTPQEREHATVWASTAERAQETAREIVNVIGERPINPSSALWEQDNGHILAAAEQGADPIAILVGHIPAMNELALILTGVPLAFEPGAACAIEFEGAPQAGSGRLAWFVQGPVVD